MNSFRKNFLYTLVFVSVFKPNMFNYWDVADLFANALSVIFFLSFSLIFLFKFLRKHEVNMMTVLIMLIHIIVLLSTYFHQGNLKHWGMALVSSGTLALFLELYANDIKSIVKVWFPIVEVFLFINILTVLTGGIANDDWLTDYFLGSKNTFEVVFATYLLIIYLNKELCHKKHFHYIFCYLLMIIAIMATRSATMVMEFGIFCILLLGKNSPLTRWIIDYRLLLSAFIAICAILIILALNSDLYIISDYLEYETDKGSSSFLVRLKMWIAGVELINAYPVFGIGRMSEVTWITYVGVGDYKTQLHNQVIEYLVSGGIILLSILLAIYVLAAYNLHKYKRNGVIVIMTLICFSLNIANLMEAYYNALYFFPFLLTGYLPCILNQLPHKIHKAKPVYNDRSIPTL